MIFFRHSVIANEVKQSPGGLLRPFGARNDTEVTDPGIKDSYIPPQPESRTEMASPAWSPLQWVQSLLTKRRVAEEAQELIAKIEKLPQAPDNIARYFFDNDLPRLVELSRQKPSLVLKMLNDSLDRTSNRKMQEPWFRLVQVACGDLGAILPALDSLC